MLSCVLIIPATVAAKGNALAAAMGWGEGNYSVPLSASGADPATHYGLHSWVGPEFVQMLQGAGEGIMPAELLNAGYPAQDFAAVTGSLIVSIRADNGGHFHEIAEANGLVVIPEKAAA